MFLSNEPGYYKVGVYGIRIENLVLVLPPQKVPGGERDMLSFETLSFAPIDGRLIEPSLMTADEIGWLNTYHAGLPAKLGHLLDPDERSWLAQATRPV
jgi:Xaa-Pro aminopeptidase